MFNIIVGDDDVSLRERVVTISTRLVEVICSALLAVSSLTWASNQIDEYMGEFIVYEGQVKTVEYLNCNVSTL